MIECSKCGAKNRADANFCSHCGAKIARITGDTTRVIPVIDDEFRDDIRAVELAPEDAAAVRDLPAGNALLIVTRGPSTGGRFLLDSEVVTVGRSPKSDIFLDDITVSRHHATFTMKDGQVTLTDQKSHNGTYVNRDLIADSAVLRQGDEVQIGRYRMLFFVSERGLR
uniref:FHA domain-containing protein n=1 Tax=Vaginimicrobium propionicum TaxID=1871034 RepID=UPI000970588B|nr:FHA domain-containing protein [Vaginimicrobium propionicum]